MARGVRRLGAERAGAGGAVVASAPQEAAQLEYVRTHTGFCRRIVVTPEDIAARDGVRREDKETGRQETRRSESSVSSSPLSCLLATATVIELSTRRPIMPTVHVNLGPRSYDIEIGSGNLAEAAQFCDAERGRCARGDHHRFECRRAVQRAGGGAARGAGLRGRHSCRRGGRAEQSRRTWRPSCGSRCSTKGPIASRSSSRWAAAWWATWPVSWRRRLPAGCGSCKFPRRCSRRSIAPSAARWASICRAARTWSARSGSRAAC